MADASMQLQNACSYVNSGREWVEFCHEMNAWVYNMKIKLRTEGLSSTVKYIMLLETALK